MMAAGIKPGDEVITTPFSFVASANCILYVDAKPVFVDIDPKTLNMDVTKVPAAITPRTKAIVGVEAFGHPGGMIELEQLAQKNELILIEDCCEGFGGSVGKGPAMRQIGSFGRAGVFGFYPNKQITTGEGGMIVTDDDTFAATCRALRNQGREGMSWLAHQRLGLQLPPQRNQRRHGRGAGGSAGGNSRRPPASCPDVHGTADDQQVPHPAHAAG
jgi:perosamine synthetase